MGSFKLLGIDLSLLFVWWTRKHADTKHSILDKWELKDPQYLLYVF